MPLCHQGAVRSIRLPCFELARCGWPPAPFELGLALAMAAPGAAGRRPAGSRHGASGSAAARRCRHSPDARSTTAASQSWPSGGASSGSGIDSSSRSPPRLTSSSRSSPSVAEEAQHEGASIRAPLRRAPRRAEPAGTASRGAGAAGRGAAPGFGARCARLGPVELARVRTSRASAGRGHDRLHLRRRDARELAAELPRARSADALGQLGHQLGEVVERAREAANSWPWNSIGVPGRQQQQRRHRAQLAPASVSSGAAAGRGRRWRSGRGSARNSDEAVRRQARAPGVPRALLLPAVALALEQEAVLRTAETSSCGLPR